MADISNSNRYFLESIPPGKDNDDYIFVLTKMKSNKVDVWRNVRPKAREITKEVYYETIAYWKKNSVL